MAPIELLAHLAKVLSGGRIPRDGKVLRAASGGVEVRFAKEAHEVEITRSGHSIAKEALTQAEIASFAASSIAPGSRVMVMGSGCGCMALAASQVASRVVVVEPDAVLQKVVVEPIAKSIDHVFGSDFTFSRVRDVPGGPWDLVILWTSSGPAIENADKITGVISRMLGCPCVTCVEASRIESRMRSEVPDFKDVDQIYDWLVKQVADGNSIFPMDVERGKM